jgi:hypothetical protein
MFSLRHVELDMAVLSGPTSGHKDLTTTSTVTFASGNMTDTFKIDSWNVGMHQPL